jgi:DNA-binding LacI/PurR family transcriptional regulator
MRVTMRDVARRTGVSIQTVSAVLNGKPGIGAATTAQVRSAIAELGYQPNLLASSLRSRRSTTIGLLLPNVANPYFAEQARGVEDVAQARGYSVMLCNTDGDPAKERTYVRLLKQYQAAGVIGGPREESAPLLWAASPKVDDRRGGYVATAHLLDLGHRRIACITGPLLPQSPGEQRLLGYRAALGDWSVAVDERLIVEGAFDFASGRRAVEVWLQRGPAPSAIFAHNDPMAIGAMAALKRAGLRIPEDVAVLGYDGTEIAALYDPPLTTVAQPTYELGAYAMTVLADCIEGNAAAPADPAVPDCALIVRRSTVAGLDEEWRCGPNTAETPWLAWREPAQAGSVSVPGTTNQRIEARASADDSDSRVHVQGR